MLATKSAWDNKHSKVGLGEKLAAKIIQQRGLHPGQQQIYQSSARNVIVCAGRRFGKTEAAKRGMYRAAMAGARVWWLAPTYQMGMDVWRDIERVFGKDPKNYINKSERMVRFAGGGMMEVKSTHKPDALRSATIDYAVLDEAAYMAPAVWPEIIRPMLLTTRGKALFISTPNGRNWFFDLYMAAVDKAHWARHHFSVYDNPRLAAEDIDEIRRETVERVFKQEYLAEFVDNSGAVFRNVRLAAVVEDNQKPVAGRRYFFGIDWGKDNDYTAIVVIDVTESPARVVKVTRLREIGWALQRGAIDQMFREWRPQVMWAESNSIGGPNIEALQSAGFPVRAFATTATSKNPMIEGLVLAIERGDLHLLKNDVLLNELMAYEVERLPGGGFRYNAPSGAHDDTVIALGVAWHGARAGTLEVIFS